MQEKRVNSLEIVPTLFEISVSCNWRSEDGKGWESFISGQEHASACGLYNLLQHFQLCSTNSDYNNSWHSYTCVHRTSLDPYSV